MKYEIHHHNNGSGSEGSSSGHSTDDREYAFGAEDAEKIASSFDYMAEAIRKFADEMDDDVRRARRMKAIITELKKIPDLTETQFFKASILLAKSEIEAAIFLLHGEDFRRWWLSRNVEGI